MTQILDDEEVAPGMSQDTKNVRFADDKNNSVANKGDSVIVVQSIGHGQIFSNNDQQQLAASPWGDVNAFNAFVELWSSSLQGCLANCVGNTSVTISSCAFDNPILVLEATVNSGLAQPYYNV